jgi:hypothetical protein
MNIMDHEQAVKMQAPERYLLNELTQEERDDFEEHYFVCTDCAEEVRAAFAFRDNARAVFASQGDPIGARAPARSKPRRDWFGWLTPSWAPVAATLLLAITLYQSVFVIPDLRKELADATSPQVLPTIVARSATRSDDAPIQIRENERFVQLVLDINATASVSSYLFEMRDESGTLVFDLTAPAPSGGSSLNLLLSASELKSGRYAITIRPSGSDSQAEVEKFTLVLERI